MTNQGLHVDGRIDIGPFGVEVTLDCRPGQTTALIGPNGSGKSTILRTVAGLHTLKNGTLKVDGTSYDDGTRAVSPQQRSVGFVFQDLRLFDHLTVAENIGFGLAARRVASAVQHGAIGEMTELFDLGALLDRKPPSLSGGQAARVALARAAASKPAVLLLDEPFAAIDVETRRALRSPFAELAASTTVLLVTHDPIEARVFADQLVVLDPTHSNSRVVQAAPPAAVAAAPATAFAAELLGTNLVTGAADGTQVTLESGAVLTTAQSAHGTVHLTFSPTAVSLHSSRPEGGSARNLWPAKVADLTERGGPVLVRLDGDVPVAAMVTPAAVADLGLVAGQSVWASVKATEITVS